MTLVQFILTVLAVARVTRLVTTDVLFESLRNKVTTRLTEPGRLFGLRSRIAYLIMCDWCASMYIGAAGAGAQRCWGDTMWFMMVSIALSASYVTGFLASIRQAGD